MNIYLIRHGETEWNNDGRYQGGMDISLNDTGLNQADFAGKALKNVQASRIYSSDLQRALKTAEIISTYTSSKIITDSRLQEIHLGEWEGKSWSTIKVQFKEYLVDWLNDMTGYPAPGGESYLDLQNRTMKSLKSITEQEQNSDNVIIVTHGAVIKTILCTLLGLGLDKRGNFEIGNGSISLVTYNPKKEKYKVSYINRSTSGEII